MHKFPVSINEAFIKLDSQEKRILLPENGVSFSMKVKENHEYRFTGEIKLSTSEKNNAALMAFECDGFVFNKDNVKHYGLKFSENVGAFTYINSLHSTHTFDITITIPLGVKKLKITVMPWFNTRDIFLGNMIFYQSISIGEKKHIFQTCKQIVYSDIDDIEILYDEHVLYRYIGDVFPYEFLAHFKSHSNKLVVFGTSAIKKDILLPVFQRHAQIEYLPDSSIIFNDPTLYVSREITVGWYQGLPEEDPLYIVSNIIKLLLPKLSIYSNNLLFYGSSASGFFALSILYYFPQAITLVTNPQTNVLLYNKNFVSIILEKVYSDMDIEAIEVSFIKRLSVNERLKNQKEFYKIWYKQNLIDKPHLINHLQPFLLEYFQKRVSSDNTRQNFIVEYYSHEKGHNAVADIDEMIQEIERAYEYFEK